MSSFHDKIEEKYLFRMTDVVQKLHICNFGEKDIHQISKLYHGFQLSCYTHVERQTRGFLVGELGPNARTNLQFWCKSYLPNVILCFAQFLNLDTYAVDSRRQERCGDGHTHQRRAVTTQHRHRHTGTGRKCDQQPGPQASHIAPRRAKEKYRSKK